MTARSDAIELASQCCDLKDRLLVVPPTAKVRGLFFRSLESELTRAGRAAPYYEAFPDRFSALGWYPTSEYLIHLVVAASLLTSPERVHEGMFELGRRYASAFMDSLMGRAMMRILSKDPKKMMLQAFAARRLSNTSGRWNFSFPDDRTADVTMSEEYLYIESSLAGGAQGAFDAISVPVRIEVTLETPYSGRQILRW